MGEEEREEGRLLFLPNSRLAKQGRIKSWLLPGASLLLLGNFIIYSSSSFSLSLYNEEDQGGGISATSIKRSSCGSACSICSCCSGCCCFSLVASAAAPSAGAFAVLARLPFWMGHPAGEVWVTNFFLSLPPLYTHWGPVWTFLSQLLLLMLLVWLLLALLEWLLLGSCWNTTLKDALRHHRTNNGDVGILQ